MTTRRYEVLDEHGEVINRVLAPPEFMEANFQHYREETTPASEPLPFAERQAHLIREVDLLAKDKRNTIVADISPAEMSSWPIKRSEALAYEASGLATDAPNLAVEADARNISLADLVDKVLAKAAQLSYIEAQIAGYAGKLQDQINAAEDEQALEAIDITAGWPV